MTTLGNKVYSLVNEQQQMSSSSSLYQTRQQKMELTNSGYTNFSTSDYLVFAFLLTIILVSIIGNLLVCLAIFTERKLRKLGNSFIVSLSFADLFVSCLVMTFALCNDFVGYWTFGKWFCEVWISFDIMCSTASILNLCAISLDRFIYIKDCLLYNQMMTRKVALSLVMLIWFVSAVLSFGPMALGLRRPESPTDIRPFSTVNTLPEFTINSTTKVFVHANSNSFEMPAELVTNSTIERFVRQSDSVHAIDNRHRMKNAKLESQTKSQPTSIDDHNSICNDELSLVGDDSSISRFVPNSDTYGSRKQTESKANAEFKSVDGKINQPIDQTVNHHANDEKTKTMSNLSIQDEIVTVHSKKISRSTQDAKNQNFQCMLTLTPTYAVVSSTISFYVPCLIMLGLYMKLYAFAKKHAKTIQALSQAPLALRDNQQEQSDTSRPHDSDKKLEDENLRQNCSSKIRLKLKTYRCNTSGDKNIGKLHFLKHFTKNTRDNPTQDVSPTKDTSFANPASANEIELSKSSLPQQQTQKQQQDPLLQQQNHQHHHNQDNQQQHRTGATHEDNTLIVSSSTDNNAQNDLTKNHQSKLPSSCRRLLPRSGQTNNTGGQQKQAGAQKAAITLGIIMGTFLFCWVPFFCINILQAFCNDCVPSWAFKFFTWLGYTNSALNPIIYGVHNSEFRNAFNRILFKHLKFKKEKRVNLFSKDKTKSEMPSDFP